VTSPDPVRIGNAERESAVRALGEHYAEGRLDHDEYEQRVSAAYAARTADDLTPLFKDLPWIGEAPTVLATAPPPVPYPAPVYPPAGYPVPAGQHDVEAPYGREPITGIPYSDRQKVIAGVLQILLPFGVGRFYSGQAGVGVAQLLTSWIGIGILWCWIDGIIMLAGRPLDQYGRPLRP
jgi:TM2 domain-containing membrane protein YozV